MTKIKRILPIILIVLSYSGIAQIEFSKWYFGTAGLDFSTSPPTLLTNSAMSGALEGVATICDNTGNLLFYAGGTGVWNSAHTFMANGTGLFGNGTSTQSDIIVKQPGSNTIYYVFTTEMVGGANGANYSIVDMSLAVGLGSVTVKNAPLYTPTCEKQVAIRHCNGKDVWILSHHYGSDQFRAYLLTNTGVSSSPVVSALGGTIAGTGLATLGHLKISPDGKKLAMATWTTSTPASLGSGGFQLFDFDAASGAVSNPLTLLSATNIPNSFAYGVEFSPDGTKLYGTTSVFSSTNTSGIYQWNICAPSASAIIASQYSISTGTLALGSIQWAIDGKLYIATSTQSLSVINNPNASGISMNFSLQALSLAPKFGASGLPNFINNYNHAVPALFSNTVACQTSSFSVPSVPTFSSGCSSTPYAPNAYLWDFGEPTSGAANTSTLSNPAHTYTALGTYTVSLILYSNCTNDTLKKVITLSTPGPTPMVSGPSEICKGEKHTYTVSGGTTYKWFNNSTAPTLTLAPTTTTVYSVAATKNGCTLSKNFTVTVNPCTGLDKLKVENDKLKVYPNPFSDEIFVETEEEGNLIISDINGSVVLETKLSSGKNAIVTILLKAGVYNLKLVNSMGSVRSKLVKME